MHAFSPDADGDCTRCPLPPNHPSHCVNPDPLAPVTDGARRGDTYTHQLDNLRLNAQARRVYDVVADERWHTLADIAHLTGDPEASVSARLRDFRKPDFRAHTVERRRRRGCAGGWEYRLRKPFTPAGVSA